MTTYAIGDVQGCFDELQLLLDKITFSKDNDQIWFVGDLVNRGPKSLEVLRFVKDLGESAITVLGNHDLHLLAVAHGVAPSNETLEPILQAPDREELLLWLRHRPLVHHCEHYRATMIHAGLPPQWSIGEAINHAREIEEVLGCERYTDYLDHMYGNKPDLWNESLTGWDRLRFITNCLTRLRFCDGSGKLCLNEKGPPGSQSSKVHPWFEVPGRRSTGETIVFGHWSALGYRSEGDIIALDTGCLWGGSLTAQVLGDRPERFSIPSLAK